MTFTPRREQFIYFLGCTVPWWRHQMEAFSELPLMYSLICASINGWVNNREAGDMRRHPAHYDVIVMQQTDICSPSYVMSVISGSLYRIRARLYPLQHYFRLIMSVLHYSDVKGALTTSQITGNDDVIKWKHFPRNWPFVRKIHRSPVNFPHKGQWRGALMFSLIYVWINDWANNREAGDLRRQHGHYDVIVMKCDCFFHSLFSLIANTRYYRFGWGIHR